MCLCLQLQEDHWQNANVIHDSPKTLKTSSDVRSSSVNKTWGKHHHFSAPLVLWKPRLELGPGSNTNYAVNVKNKGFWVYFSHFPNMTFWSKGSFDSYEPFVY